MMKKHVDAFGYNTEEFEDWWKESINKMISFVMVIQFFSKLKIELVFILIK